MNPSFPGKKIQISSPRLYGLTRGPSISKPGTNDILSSSNKKTTMDHLNLSLGEEFTVRYYENEFDPKTSDFHTFPKKFGWQLDEKTFKFHPDTSSKESVVPDKKEFNKFIQSWLFFGLMATVLKDDSWRPNMFVSRDRSIDTKALPSYLEAWEKREAAADKHSRTLRMIKAQVALDKARNVVLRNCSFEGEESRDSPTRVDEELALSLMVLGETLTNAKCKIVERVAFNIRGWHGDANEGWGIPACVITRMLKNGWCKNTIHMLKGQLRSHATSLLSVYKSHQAQVFEGHGACCEEQCIVKSTEDDGKTYMTRHQGNCRKSNSSEDQICEFIGPDIEKVVKVIEDKGIPLLKYQCASDGKMMVEVVPYSAFQDYATISHVWSDGYGNEEENKLRKCQLDFFASIFQQISGSKADDNATLFWIDTLAIPVNRHLYMQQRKAAINQINEIFTKAKYTIVLDNGLSKMSFGKTYQSTALKILASRWMRRLWTLQEAYLSKRLYFAFRTDTITERTEMTTLEELEDMYPQANHILSSNIPTSARSYFHNLLGNDRKARIHDIPSPNGYGLLANIWKAAQWRTLQHPEQEALVLATLLDLTNDESSFAESGLISMKPDQSGTPKPERKLEDVMEKSMKELWDALDQTCPGSIPSGIIFLPGQRMTTQGYGWAPRQWTSGQRIDYPDPLSNMVSAGMLVKDKGLQVRYPGLLLHAKSSDAILWPDNKPIYFPSDSTLLEWYQVKQADDRLKGTFAERAKELAIILCRPKPRELYEIALLVEIDNEITQRLINTHTSSKLYQVHIVCRVWIKRETGIDQLSDTWKQFILQSGNSNDDKFICGEVLENDQQWIVDGLPRKLREKIPLNDSDQPPTPSGPPMVRANDAKGKQKMEQTGNAETSKGGHAKAPPVRGPQIQRRSPPSPRDSLSLKPLALRASPLGPTNDHGQSLSPQMSSTAMITGESETGMSGGASSSMGGEGQAQPRVRKAGTLPAREKIPWKP